MTLTTPDDRRPNLSKRTLALSLAVVLTLGGLTGCGKFVEPYNDAPVSGQNKNAAEVVNMPDGFSNVATKCDHGNRVYVAYHGDSAYGSVAVSPKDPSCPQG